MCNVKTQTLTHISNDDFNYIKYFTLHKITLKADLLSYGYCVEALGDKNLRTYKPKC